MCAAGTCRLAVIENGKAVRNTRRHTCQRVTVGSCGCGDRGTSAVRKGPCSRSALRCAARDREISNRSRARSASAPALAGEPVVSTPSTTVVRSPQKESGRDSISGALRERWTVRARYQSWAESSVQRLRPGQAGLARLGDCRQSCHPITARGGTQGSCEDQSRGLGAHRLVVRIAHAR